MNLETFPKNETSKQMLSYLTPGFYDESYVGKWLFEVMGKEIEEAAVIFDELPLQVFPETATWGLTYLEEKYGLPNRKDLSDQERRKLIIQKRDTKAPMTPYAMEHLLKTVTDFKVRVSDTNDVFQDISKPISHPNVFQVILTGEGTAEIGKIKPLLDRIKQSHTLYDLMYYQIYRHDVKIKYENTIKFRTAFYPRYNFPFLYLDNIWRLDRGRMLSGYNADSLVDFYPVYLRFKVPVENPIESDQQLKTMTDAQEKITESAKLLYPIKIRASPEAAERFCINTAVEERSSAGQVGVMNLNVLDNEWKLDSSRKLNGGLSIL